MGTCTHVIHRDKVMHIHKHTQRQNKKKILKLNQCLKIKRKLRRQVSRQSACSSMRTGAWIPRIYVKPGTDSCVHNPSASTVRWGVEIGSPEGCRPASLAFSEQQQSTKRPCLRWGPIPSTALWFPHVCCAHISSLPHHHHCHHHHTHGNTYSSHKI